MRELVEASYDGGPMFFSHFAGDVGVALVENAEFEIVQQDFILQVEHGVEGGFLWVLARSS